MGWPVGLVGMDEGTEVGFVGTEVGEVVGCPLGSDVGCREGCELGLLVG